MCRLPGGRPTQEECAEDVQAKLAACRVRMKAMQAEEERIVAEMFARESKEFGKQRRTTSREDGLRRRYQAIQLRKVGIGPLVPLVLPTRQKLTNVAVREGGEGGLFSSPVAHLEPPDAPTLARYHSLRSEASPSVWERATLCSTASPGSTITASGARRLPPVPAKLISSPVDSELLGSDPGF